VLCRSTEHVYAEEEGVNLKIMMFQFLKTGIDIHGREIL